MEEENIISELENIIEDRIKNPREGSYISKILEEEKVLEKLGEESIELIISSKDGKNIIHEAADLLFHLLILCSINGIKFNDVLKELEERRRG